MITVRCLSEWNQSQKDALVLIKNLFISDNSRLAGTEMVSIMSVLWNGRWSLVNNMCKGRLVYV